MKKKQLQTFLISSQSSIVDAMRKIDINAKGILFVVDIKQRLLGVISDGDIRRWLIKTGDLNGKVSQIMNKKPYVIFQNDINLARRYMEEYTVNAIPFVTDLMIIHDVFFKSDVMKNQIVTEKKNLRGVDVVIMAGGKGTRLYPYTKILPKPLIPIGDIPIMERIINRFQEYGAVSFYATVNYRRSMIKSYFTDIVAEYQLKYVDEDKPLGTAGSLRLFKEKLKKSFFVTNCDILIDADYDEIYRYHTESGNELTIVSALKNIMVPYGVIHTSEHGKVVSMEEKPELSYFVNTGMYILNPDLIKDIPADTVFHMTDLIDILLKKKRKVGMYPISEDSFLDMGELEEMHRMEQKLNLRQE